jgi:TP901 family phage tail tape measure protein
MGEKVKGATSGIASKLSSLSPSIAAVGDKFKGVTAGIKDHLASLGTHFDAAKAKLAGIVSSVATTMKSLALPIAAAGAAVGAAAVYGVKKFADFEQGMNQVFTLMPGASAEVRDQMIADVKKISSEMGIMTDQTIPALYDAIGAGVPPENVFAFIEVAQKAAVGGATDLTTTIDGLTSVVNAYGADILDAATASDIMFQTVNVGKVSFEDLANRLYNVVPTAQALGISFGEVGAAIAAMTAQGVPASVATTQLRQMFVELSKEGGKTSTLFKELSGKSFREFIAGGGTVQEALQLLEKHAGAANVGINDLFGSVEAGSGALVLTGRGTEAFTEALATMEDSAGATQSAYETMEQGINRQLEKLAADFNVIVLDIAGALVPVVNDYILPALRGIVDGIKTVMSWFGAAADSPDSLVGSLRGSLAPAVEYFQGKLDDLQAWWDDHSPAFLAAWDALSASIQWSIENIVTPIATALVPVLDFFQEKLAYIFDWYEANAPLFIAAWENIGAAVKWVIDTVIVPLIEWAWPYIETIISGVLDMLLSKVKLFTALLAGDWEAAGEALTEISKGATQALVGVISMGWDAIATGIEWVGQGILGFVYGLWKNIVQWTEDSLNKMIDLINGFIEAANSVTEKVGISLPKLGRIHLQADKIEIPKLKIQRWSETSFSKEIDEFLKKDEEEEEEEEEDIDKEFEDEPEREPAPALPKSQLPVAPKPEIPATPPAATIRRTRDPGDRNPDDPGTVGIVPALDIRSPSPSRWRSRNSRISPTYRRLPPIPPTSVEIPETEPPTIPDLPEPGVPESSPAPTPAFSLPLPVTVINWPDALRPVQAAPPATEEQAEPAEEEEDIDKEFEKELEPEPTLSPPKFGLPVAPKPEIPAVPPAAFSLPLPVTVINWPDTLKPVPAVPLTEEERVTPADKEPDVDEEFVDLPEPTIVWPDLPKIQIPKIQVPDIVAAAMPPDPDAGALTRILGLIGGGETRVVVELDGYAIGETLFRTWNRRTGGALNG